AHSATRLHIVQCKPASRESLPDFMARCAPSRYCSQAAFHLDCARSPGRGRYGFTQENFAGRQSSILRLSVILYPHDFGCLASCSTKATRRAGAGRKSDEPPPFGGAHLTETTSWRGNRRCTVIRNE